MNEEDMITKIRRVYHSRWSTLVEWLLLPLFVLYCIYPDLTDPVAFNKCALITLAGEAIPPNSIPATSEPSDSRLVFTLLGILLLAIVYRHPADKKKRP